jgi:uncharacterized pyridoxamine 5'-phosphate oxidase family protein
MKKMLSFGKNFLMKVEVLACLMQELITEAEIQADGGKIYIITMSEKAVFSQFIADTTY